MPNPTEGIRRPTVEDPSHRISVLNIEGNDRVGKAALHKLKTAKRGVLSF